MKRAPLVAAIAATSITACGGKGGPAGPAKPEAPALDVEEPWSDPEAERPGGKAAASVELSAALSNPDAKPIVIEGATVLTAAGKSFTAGTIILSGGAIQYVGDAPPAAPEGARVIDGKGKVVTPGLIDSHSHIGVYAAPSANANQDGNEAVAPVTAYAQARYGYWPQDPQIPRAIAGGVTTALILPG